MVQLRQRISGVQCRCVPSRAVETPWYTFLHNCPYGCQQVPTIHVDADGTRKKPTLPHMLATKTPPSLYLRCSGTKGIPFRTWTDENEKDDTEGWRISYLQVLAMGFSHWILFRSSICPLRPLVSASPMRPFVANWLASTRVLLSQLSGIPNRYDFSVQDPWWWWWWWCDDGNDYFL